MGEERTVLEKACELKYYQACHYKWTDDRGPVATCNRGLLGKRCKSMLLRVYLDGRAMLTVIPHRRHQC